MNTNGKRYEDLACSYLENKGYSVLERNYTCRYGEIDIIAKQGDYTVFVEVKYRGGEDFMSPVEAITPQKVEKIVKTAKDYISKHGEDDFFRFDAVCITGEKIEHLENVFYL